MLLITMLLSLANAAEVDVIHPDNEKKVYQISGENSVDLHVKNETCVSNVVKINKRDMLQILCATPTGNIFLPIPCVGTGMGSLQINNKSGITKIIGKCD